jgi:hypothetical protein
MSVVGYLLGRPLSSREESTQQFGVFDGVAAFGLDAPGSARSSFEEPPGCVL